MAKAAQAQAAQVAYKATLVRGQTYFIGALKFYKGIPQVISAVTKKKLERDAVDRFTMIGADGKEVEIKQKFKFEEIPAALAPKPKANKAAELAVMQSTGGVSFEDDEEETEQPEEEVISSEQVDEYAVDEEDEGEASPETPAPAPKGRRR